jgi:hypothetical protein
LASATAVDGHNWMYPVCFGIFYSETSDNWEWFIQNLRGAIESPRGLTISTNAGQAIMSGVEKVFPEVEHRECMFHLVSNFKKSIMVRFLMTIFGQLLTHGILIYLRNIGMLWRQQSLQQLHILGSPILGCGLGVSFQLFARWTM